MNSLKIGVLAVQGAFIEHEQMIRRLGCSCVELRKASDLAALDGLILPGGESTVQGKLLKELGMLEPLKQQIQDGLPTLATCAGLILLAEKIENDDAVYFGTLPVTVRRNAYGRQLGSHRIVSDFKGIGPVSMTFIRAPYIEKADPPVDILSREGNFITGVRYQNQIAIAFHPELQEDPRIHALFLSLAKEHASHSAQE